MVTAGIQPFRKISYGRNRNRARDLTISRQRLWSLDHKTGQNSSYKIPHYTELLIPFIFCRSGSNNILCILFSDISSTFYYQISRLHPILKLFFCILISHIPSAVSSQNFPLLSILNHLPRILFSNTNSISLSQTYPQYTIHKTLQLSYSQTSIHSQTHTHYSIHKHLLPVLFSNIHLYLILKHLRSIPFPNITSPTQSQTSRYPLYI